MISHIEEKITPLKKQLLNHELYKNISSFNDLKIFLNTHVYAVWDFMSLLKALQNELTCTTIPWYPTNNSETRYLINEIVLAEETDINKDGFRQSHFEMYIDAMKSCNIDTSYTIKTIQNIASSKNIFKTISETDISENLKQFLTFTFEVALHGKPHEIAAAFTFGREDLIPSMFSEILKNIQSNVPDKDLSDLVYYFDRHIELDEDEHGPMALKMIESLCESSKEKWNEVEKISIKALNHRIQLWNSINYQINKSKPIKIV